MQAPQAFALPPQAPMQQQALQLQSFMGVQNQIQQAPVQQQFPQPQSLMELQSQIQQAPAQKNTYTAVRSMVDQMSAQVQSSEADEAKHRDWCDSEISKNQAVLDDKGGRLQRLTTKIDGQKEMVSELDQDLQLLEKEAQSLQAQIQAFGRLRLQERNAYQKASQNRQMAQQILSQATMILQRFNSLAQDSTQQQGSAFLQGGASQQIMSVSAAAIDGLNQMNMHYQQLKTTSDQADNQAQLDAEKLSQLNQALAAVLGQTRSYKSSLRLQSMSELDSDREDANALHTQVESVTAYVNRLRQACADILTHYDERQTRRAQSLKALQEARGAINMDNAQEAQSQIAALANSADSAAQSLLSSSASLGGVSNVQNAAGQPQPQQVSLSASLSMMSQMAGNLGAPPTAQQPMPQQSMPHQFQQMPQPQLLQPAQSAQAIQATQFQQRPQQLPPNAALRPSSNPQSILGDLKSLQDMNFDAGQQRTGGLNMLASQ